MGRVVAGTDVELDLEETQEEGECQGLARVGPRGETKADLDLIEATKTTNGVGLSASKTLRQTEHLQARRLLRKVDCLGSIDRPWADLEEQGSVSHDVDTAATLDAGGLGPLQTLNTDGTVVGDLSKRLGNSGNGRSTCGLAKIDSSAVQPADGRTKDDGRNQGVSADTNPHVAGVGERGNRVKGVDTDNVCTQRVEGEVARVLNGTGGDRHRRNQAIGRGHVEATLVVQVTGKGGESVVHNGVVDTRVDGETSNLQAQWRHGDSVVSDGQGQRYCKAPGRSKKLSDGAHGFGWNSCKNYENPFLFILQN